MKKFISFLLVAALFAACTHQNEVGTPFKAGQEVTLTAHMPNAGNNGAQQLPSKQRISGKDTGTQIDLTWDTGDQIKVTVGNKSATFTLASGAGSAQATFTGVMPADGDSYSVQYPIADPNLSVQTYVENGFSKGLMKMTTKTNGTLNDGFTLSADYALFGLQLTGSDALSKIILTNRANTSETYTLNCLGVNLTNIATLFYVVVPAGEWANGFQVDVYKDDNSIIKTFEKTSSAIFSAIEAMIMPTQEVTDDNYDGIGVFTVAEGKTVAFAPGNLQYHPANDKWRFAENQPDYIGDANSNISSTYNGWLDLFGWGTGDNPTNTIHNATEYPTFNDWGSNKIGNDLPNTWRTLTKDEWVYIFNTRANASALYGIAKVNEVDGLIVLPDDWSASPLSANQSFTADQWLEMEQSGAVFLPASGYRNGTGVSDSGNALYYWSATNRLAYNAYYIYCLISSSINPKKDTWRYQGHAVRLVKDL